MQSCVARAFDSGLVSEESGCKVGNKLVHKNDDGSVSMDQFFRSNKIQSWQQVCIAREFHTGPVSKIKGAVVATKLQSKKT